MHYIGTSGYSYPDWVGSFYPEGTRQADFLARYAESFTFTELNFSYYRMPDAGMLGKMLERVPGGFLFSIKAHGSLTHERDESWKSGCARFYEALKPLTEAKALAGILLQFPFSFHYTAENRLYLDALLAELEPLPRFVEFRNSEWQIERVYEALDRREAGVVTTDEPRLEGLPSFSPRLCGRDAYFRFHGRNRRDWWTGDNISRYDYRYSMQELDEFGEAIRAIEPKARRLFAAFNNHRKGQAVDNARELIRIIDELPKSD
jgi:uncharacterized protein YecE (DUF72 family)